MYGNQPSFELISRLQQKYVIHTWWNGATREWNHDGSSVLHFVSAVIFIQGKGNWKFCQHKFPANISRHSFSLPLIPSAHVASTLSRFHFQTSPQLASITRTLLYFNFKRPDLWSETATQTSSSGPSYVRPFICPENFKTINPTVMKPFVRREKTYTANELLGKLLCLEISSASISFCFSRWRASPPKNAPRCAPTFLFVSEKSAQTAETAQIHFYYPMVTYLVIFFIKRMPKLWTKLWAFLLLLFPCELKKSEALALPHLPQLLPKSSPGPVLNKSPGFFRSDTGKNFRPGIQFICKPRRD